jgi:excisionase family DNA binding protein
MVDEPITATVKTFCQLSGLGKTKVFEMIADGTLDTIKLGARRLIVMESYRRLIAAQVRSGSPEVSI